MVSADNSREAQVRDDRAYALMQSAVALVPQGKWREASQALEEAAAMHAEAGRAYDEARCLQLAATLRRAGGETGKAQALVERATAAAPHDLPLAVSIAAEKAETAFREGRFVDAATAWSTALENGLTAGLKPEGQSAILRRRAAASVASGQIERANADFDRAYELHATVDGVEAAGFVRIEQADTLCRWGFLIVAEGIVTKLASEVANTKVGPHLMAELLVLQAKLVRIAGRMNEARDYALRARTAALEAIAPLSYFRASVELAETLQATGDLAGAYGALSTAWATLSDVLGGETASSWIEPCLLTYQIRWGEAEFRRAKGEYESRRRAELQHDERREGGRKEQEP